jgi:hypothetical protein
MTVSIYLGNGFAKNIWQLRLNIFEPDINTGELMQSDFTVGQYLSE